MVPSDRIGSQLLVVSKPLFAPAVRRQTLVRVAVIVAFLFALNGLNVVNSYVGRDFMTALANREADTFYLYALFYLGIFAASTGVAVFYQFFQDRLALFWRQTLTRHVLGQYLADQAYFRLQGRTEIDNPDQRIAEDIRSYTTTLLSFFLLILNATLTILAFAGILWSISPRLFAAAVAYAGFGSLITLLLGYKLVHLNFVHLAKEGDLRYGLVRIREYAESIALHHGEPAEVRQVNDRLDQVVEVVNRIIYVNRKMGLFTSLFNYIVPILPVVVVAPLYLRGELEFGQVTQAAMAFAQFLGGLAVFISQFQNISVFAAVVDRLGSLDKSIRDAQGPAHIRIVRDDKRVAYDNLTLRTSKDGRVLVKDLSLDVRIGQRLLINGPDGFDNSVLFRATAGVSTTGSGTVLCPEPGQIMFLPQKPYTIVGTLREQILYGLHDRGISDAQLLAALAEVKLDTVVRRVGGLDADRDWPQTLTVGERQLLAFVRLLLANPRFAFLDQAIASLSPQCARQIYTMLARSNITYLSIGDHSPIEEYHDLVLDLAEDGSWTTRPANREPAA